MILTRMAMMLTRIVIILTRIVMILTLQETFLGGDGCSVSFFVFETTVKQLGIASNSNDLLRRLWLKIKSNCCISPFFIFLSETL